MTACLKTSSLQEGFNTIGIYNLPNLSIYDGKLHRFVVNRKERWRTPVDRTDMHTHQKQPCSHSHSHSHNYKKGSLQNLLGGTRAFGSSNSSTMGGRKRISRCSWSRSLHPQQQLPLEALLETSWWASGASTAGGCTAGFSVRFQMTWY